MVNDVFLMRLDLWAGFMVTRQALINITNRSFQPTIVRQ